MLATLHDLFYVAPMRGVCGLKLRHDERRFRLAAVAPSKGAWIEEKDNTKQTEEGRLAPHEASGLKLTTTEFYRAAKGRPYGVCGLKFFHFAIFGRSF
jgi:hypothetical protein